MGSELASLGLGDEIQGMNTRLKGNRVMTRRIALAIMITAIPAIAAADDSYIRLESWRDPAAASASAERWAEKFPDVVTYPVGGWHAVALGPFEDDEVSAHLSDLKAEGAIPGDAVIVVPDDTIVVARISNDTPEVEAAQAEEAPAIPGAVASTAAIITSEADTAADEFPDADSQEADNEETSTEAAQEDAADAIDSATHISIEAYRDRNAAEAALARWQASLPQVSLWALDSGWFAITAGPYAPEEAAAQLADLKQKGSIPGDAFLSGEGALGEKLTTAEAPDTAAAPEPESPPAAEAEAEAEPEPAETAPPPEMPSLDLVQEVLLWAGHYEGEIDGRPGPMTSTAIRAALEHQDLDPTEPGADAIAIHTLLTERETWREEMGLGTLHDAFTDLSLTVPLPSLEFLRTDQNLSIYGPQQESGAALILFNQEGGRTEMQDLAGLITALGWVPNPEREIATDHFRLDGHNALHIGHAEAQITDGRVQGFVLIWPYEDAENAPRLIREAAATLTTGAPGAL